MGRLPPLGDIGKATTRWISNGLRGNLQTVTVMQQLAHQAAGDPLIQGLAKTIVLQAGVPSHYYIDEAVAIGQFVQAHVRYSRDPDGYEQLQTPERLVSQISAGVAQGDCDDMALLTSALLLAIGHQPYYRMVRYDTESGPYAHIYVVDYDTNPGTLRTRVVLDCILKDRPIGSEVGQASGEEVEV